MKEELKAFYVAMALWIKEGMPAVLHMPLHDLTFMKGCGLCGNWLYFCDEVYPASSGRLKYIEAQFRNAGLCFSYPFNADGMSYYDETRLGILYANKERLKWISDHAS